MENLRSKDVGVGGFYLPAVYQKEQKQVAAALDDGRIDYADLTNGVSWW